MDLLIDEAVRQVLLYVLSTVLSTLIAAFAVGGVMWKKMHINEVQNTRMDELQRMIKSNEAMLRTMSCHQLQISCYRAVERGCITFDEKQEIKRLYDQYREKNWNGPGEIAYQAMDKLPVQDSCD